MSYTPTTWTTGDTITATAMNKIENGIANAGNVATVIVDFDNGYASSGMIGSQYFNVGYAQYTNGVYSIESMMPDYMGNAPYQGRCYVPVPLTDDEDDFKPYIFFDGINYSAMTFTVTGDISSEDIYGVIRTGASTWESAGFIGFEVSGNGKIVVEYFD